MDSDVLFVVGIVLVALGVPSLVSAFSESRPPRAAATAFLLGGALIAFAAVSKPGGYEFGDIPDVVMHVVARAIR
ncbi:hypothetical protein [Frigidibacter mobilis]|uniref:50S ribosomal protein L35 n=1 Tax=Frigidibacter mobilis TaxID=1335048 RepID=A0A159Z8B0_9RHOB|nr:hypothetical protein [Frigidibacter mobilis]AMY70814.1 hypothetical protein AKL17_3590 [Frigidibacter mobilis]